MKPPARLAEVFTWSTWVSLLLAFYSVAGCSKRVETAAAVHAELLAGSSSAATVATVTHVQQAPGRETVYTFAPLSPEQAARKPLVSAPTIARAPAGGPPVLFHLPDEWGELPPHGALLSIAVKETGAVVADTSQQAQASTETHEAAKDDRSETSRTVVAPALSCAFAGWMWGVLVVGALAGLLWLRLR